MLVTSRVVGYQPARLRDAEFRHYMLQDLDPEQIETFVERWHQETFDDPEQVAPKRERLQKAIRDSKSIAMLAGNPLLLTMMAILNRNQELPRDRVDLYAQASRVLLHQWDTERALEDFPGMSAEVGLREKTGILRRVAAHMQAGPGGLQGSMIDGAALTGLIEDYLQTELNFAQFRAAARAVVEQLRQRNFILCFVGADSYAFVHRTFLEYFCAADFVHRFNVAKTLDIDGLIVLFDEHCRQDDWREVLRLICGQIDEAFVGRIVEHLATRTDLEKWDGKTALPEFPLAIWCLSEARSLSRLENVVNLIFEKLISLGLPWMYSEELMVFLEEVLVAAKDISWKNKEYAKKRIRSVVPELVGYSCGQRFFPKLFSIVAGRCEEFLEFIDSREGRSPEVIRATTLQALAEKWPDERTRELLARRVLEDPSPDARGAAWLALGGMHSELGRVLPTRDLDGIGSYLDPLAPIPRERIEQAAKEAGIRPEDIDVQVASLSAHLGWDITLGAKESG
jgi:hypothetical protein